MWVAVAVLVLLAIRLVTLLSRRTCTETNICADDYGFVVVVGFCAIVVILGSLYGIDKLAPGGRVPSPLRGLVHAYHPDSDGLEPNPPGQQQSRLRQARPDNLEQRLGRLEALRRAGSITDQEYAQRRAEMLREL